MRDDRERPLLLVLAVLLVLALCASLVQAVAVVSCSAAGGQWFHYEDNSTECVR